MCQKNTWYYWFFQTGEKLDSKGGVCFDVSKWSLVGIPKGVMIDDYSKIREVLGCKEAASLGVSEWDLVRIHEGAILGTKVGNDK